MNTEYSKITKIKYQLRIILTSHFLRIAFVLSNSEVYNNYRLINTRNSHPYRSLLPLHRPENLKLYLLS